MRIAIVLLLAALAALAHAEDIPDWVMPGILYVESHSAYREDGTIHYVKRSRGAHGERGCFQCTRIAFDQVKRPGEQFWQIETDTVFAAEIAWRYLHWLRGGGRSWEQVVESYNAGPGRRSVRYLMAVKAAGGAP